MKSMIEGLPFAEYRAHPGLNWSSLKHHGRSPAHYRYAVDNPPSQTPSMLMGSALHALILEGRVVFESHYIQAPEGLDRRTKAGREQWAEFEQVAMGKEVLTAGQYEQVQGMAAAIAAHSLAGELLAKCRRREVVLSWRDHETGIDCKARLDALADFPGFILDIKTTEAAATADFQRTVLKYQYHGQGVFYADGTARVLGCEPPAVVLLAVEKTPPYAVVACVLESDFMDIGRSLVRRLLRQHAACVADDKWPAYSEELQVLTPPRWAVQQETDEVTV